MEVRDDDSIEILVLVVIDDNLSPWWDFTILPDIVSLRSNDLTFIEMKFYFWFVYTFSVSYSKFVWNYLQGPNTNDPITVLAILNSMELARFDVKYETKPENPGPL